MGKENECPAEAERVYDGKKEKRTDLAALEHLPQDDGDDENGDTDVGCDLRGGVTSAFRVQVPIARTGVCGTHKVLHVPVAFEEDGKARNERDDDTADEDI